MALPYIMHAPKIRFSPTLANERRGVLKMGDTS
jgi:hypothetical protein